MVEAQHCCCDPRELSGLSYLLSPLLTFSPFNLHPLHSPSDVSQMNLAPKGRFASFTPPTWSYFSLEQQLAEERQLGRLGYKGGYYAVQIHAVLQSHRSPC